MQPRDNADSASMVCCDDDVWPAFLLRQVKLRLRIVHLTRMLWQTRDAILFTRCLGAIT